MAHLTDQFRYSFDKVNQIVALSICINENRTIEHSVPVSEFYEMVQHFRKNENYTGNFLKLKITTDSILLSIRISQLTRRAYNFSFSEFGRLVSQFRSSINEEEIDLSVEFDELQDSCNKVELGVLLDDLTSELDKIDEITSTIRVLEKRLLRTDQRIAMVLTKMNELSQQIPPEKDDRTDEILEAIKGIESPQLIDRTDEIISAIQNQPKVVERVEVENYDKPNTTDMPMFIPTSMNTEFAGKVATQTAKATDDNVQSAANALKKLKERKKK